jgi:hypothetical protein
MHLSYSGVDLDTGARARAVDHALHMHRVTNRGGELCLPVPDEMFGEALFSFVQAISQVAGTALWTRQRVSAAFHEDADTVLRLAVSPEKMTEKFTDPDIDPEGHYSADYLVRGASRDYLVFVVNTDHQCLQATITCMHFERMKRRHPAIVLFEDMTQLPRRSVAQLTNVADKQFANLDKDRVTRYFREEVLRTPSR